MFCRSCGAEVDAVSRFCEECGAVLTIHSVRSRGKPAWILPVSLVAGIIATVGLVAWRMTIPSPPEIAPVSKNQHASQAAWAMYRGDAQRTGRSRFSTVNSAGRIAWTYSAPVETDPTRPHVRTSPVIAADGTIYWALPAKLISLTPAGSLRWERALKHDCPRIAVLDPTTVVVGNSRCGQTLLGQDSVAQVVAVSAEGEQKWEFEFNGHIEDLVVGPSGTIYLRTGGGVLALSPGGTRKWRYSINDDLVFDRSLCVTLDETVYTTVPHVDEKGNRNLRLISLDRDGHLHFEFNLGLSLTARGLTNDAGFLYTITPPPLGNSSSRETDLLRFQVDLTLRSATRIRYQGGYPGPYVAISAGGDAYVSTGPDLVRVDFERNRVTPIALPGVLVPSKALEQYCGEPILDIDGRVLVPVLFITPGPEERHFLVSLDSVGTPLWTLEIQAPVDAVVIGGNGTIFATTRDRIYTPTKHQTLYSIR